MSLLNRIRNTLDVIHGFDEVPETEQQTLQAKSETAFLKSKLNKLGELALENVPGSCVQAVLLFSGFSPEVRAIVSEIDKNLRISPTIVEESIRLSPKIKDLMTSKPPKL